MAIQSRNRRFISDNPNSRKADQEWEMAGLARQDGDIKAMKKHTDKAREYERLAREFEHNRGKGP